MKITAIIAEYNPFHNGHSHQLRKALELTEADYIICIMSGDYVQRGTPAIIDKYSRAEMALSEGADLVIELPLCYSLSSIENYAYGAVSLADKLGAVDSLCFGAENDDIDKLKELASFTLQNDDNYRETIHKYIREGQSYPMAMSNALLEAGMNEEDASVLRSPNNALGIYYIRALLKLHSDIKPYAVKRIVSDHHDTETGAYSATAIRTQLGISYDKEVLYELTSSMPESAIQILNSALGKRFPIESADFSQILFYKLHSLYTLALQQYPLRETARKKALTDFLDINEELSSRIILTYREALDFDDLCSKIKSRDLTYTRISRCLMHILLDIRKDNMDKYLNEMHYYARILGLNRNAHDLMHTLKEHSLIPLLSKLADYTGVITDDTGKLMLHEDIQAADLYESVIRNKFGTLFHSEYTKQVVLK
ncbi:MAG: nucleotidyltransferase family protein [Lachnospiraceae bacterium]|nr:nucleotidyltransferase family protein [Lachnospiraceae bacterium]